MRARRLRREARERHCLVADESAADEDHVELDSLLDDSDHADEVEGSSHDEVEAGSSDHELDVDGSLHFNSSSCRFSISSFSVREF